MQVLFHQEESQSAMLQINAERGAHLPVRQSTVLAHHPSSFLLMAPSLACLEKMVLTVHCEDGGV